MALGGLAFIGQGYQEAADVENRRRLLQAQLAAQVNQQAALAALGNTGSLDAPPGTTSIPQGPVPPTSLVGQQPGQGTIPSFARMGAPPSGALPWSGGPSGSGPVGSYDSGVLTGGGTTFSSPFTPGQVNAAIPSANRFAPGGPPGAPQQPGGGGQPPPGYVQPGYPEMVARARQQLAAQMAARYGGQPQPQGELPPEIAVPRAQGNQPQTWQAIVQQIRRANPNAPPEVIAEAALKAVPLMSMLSREQQQAMMNQLRGVQQDIALERLQMMQARQTGGEVNAWADKVEDYQTSLRSVPAQIRSQVVEALGNRKPADYKGEQGFAAYKDYTTPNSKTNMTNKSLMTIQQHLDVWEDMAKVVASGNTQSPLANSVINWVRANVNGAGNVTSINQAKEYLASEMVKAVQGAAGTGAERIGIAGNFGPNGSPGMVVSNVDTARKFIAGQRATQKQQYEKLTGRKDYDQLFETLKYEPASASDAGTHQNVPFTIKKSEGQSTLGKVASYLNPVGSAQAGEFPPGKTDPSRFLDYERRPADLRGGAPLVRTPVKTSEMTKRATQTKPLNIGKEGAILEAGEENLAKGPTAQELLKLENVVERNSFPGDELRTDFARVFDAVRGGMPFRQAMLKYGTEDMLQGIERILKKDRSKLGLGWPEDLPFQRE